MGGKDGHAGMELLQARHELLSCRVWGRWRSTQASRGGSGLLGTTTAGTLPQPLNSWLLTAC